MKKKTIILFAILGISISLTCIIAASFIHFKKGDFIPVTTTPHSESTNCSPDITMQVTLSPESSETTSDNSPISSQNPEDTTKTVSDQTDQNTQPDTTIEVTTEEATTAEETTAEETTAHTHNYSDWIQGKAPTCESDGENYRVCSCGHTEFQPIPANGHAKETLAEIKSTCTSEGKTEGVVCSVCNAVLKKQTTVPKTDCEYKNLICINCGMVKEIDLSLTAPYAGLYKADSLQCIYSVSPEIETPQASLTKIITACVALEYMSIDTVITIGTELKLVPKNSSLSYVYKGHRLKLYDLLSGMLLCSGNDAAYSVAVNVARHVSGDKSMSDEDAVEYFCKLMNDYAKAIGANNTTFTTPDGSDSEGQYSTVADIAIITAHAMKNEIISEIVSIQYKKVIYESGQIANWTNTNELLNPDSKYYTPGVNGFKTGTTENAGTCLSATFEDEGQTYIAIVLGCEDNDARYENILELIRIIKEA